MCSSGQLLAISSHENRETYALFRGDLPHLQSSNVKSASASCHLQSAVFILPTFILLLNTSLLPLPTSILLLLLIPIQLKLLPQIQLPCFRVIRKVFGSSLLQNLSFKQ